MKLADPFRRAGEHIEIALPGARALFTTRRGGHSTGPYESLNLGRLTDDEPVNVERNRAAVEAQLGVALTYVRQVHRDGVVMVEQAPPPATPLTEADAQVTALRGIGLTVLSADCLPIALAGRGAAAAVHAGWRGLAGGVIANAVQSLAQLAGDESLTAAIGPGAGPCCYDVGEEVHAAFASYGEAVRHGRSLDLKAIASAQLTAAGVATVYDVGLCTICSDPALFFSHRRDRGVTGRQAGIVWLS